MTKYKDNEKLTEFIAAMQKYLDQGKNDAENANELIDDELQRMFEEMDDKEFTEIFEGVAEFTKQYLKTTNKKKAKNYRNIVPEQIFIGNSKLSNQLTHKVLDNGKIHLDLKLKNKEPILTILQMEYKSPNLSIENYVEFTPYDQLVHDRVCTLYEAGNSVFTPEMVVNIMTGRDSRQYVNESTVKDVIESINKSRMIKVFIDHTAEWNFRNKSKKTDNFILNDMMLSAKEVTISMGGVEKTAYEFNSKPIIYEYNQENRQILSIPLEIFELGDMSNTKENMLLKEYLIKRIEPMKHKKNSVRSNNITYETLYKELDANVKDRTIKKRIRDKAKKVLKDLKKNKYIADFIEYPEDKRTKTGLTIEI